MVLWCLQLECDSEMWSALEWSERGRNNDSSQKETWVIILSQSPDCVQTTCCHSAPKVLQWKGIKSWGWYFFFFFLIKSRLFTVLLGNTAHVSLVRALLRKIWHTYYLKALQKHRFGAANIVLLLYLFPCFHIFVGFLLSSTNSNKFHPWEHWIFWGSSKTL